MKLTIQDKLNAKKLSGLANYYKRKYTEAQDNFIKHNNYLLAKSRRKK